MNDKLNPQQKKRLTEEIKNLSCLGGILWSAHSELRDEFKKLSAFGGTGAMIEEKHLYRLIFNDSDNSSTAPAPREAEPPAPDALLPAPIAPEAVVDDAAPRDDAVPTPVQSTVTKPEVTPAADKPDDGITPAERRAKHDMTQERGCRRLILENWDTIEELHGSNPRCIEIRRIVVRKLQDGEAEPVLKTVRNTRDILRKAGLIP